MAMSSSHNDENPPEKCFLDWMELEEVDLAELLQALRVTDDGCQNTLRELIEKGITHFQDYRDKRAQLAPNYVCEYFAPNWNSSLENSLLWLGGCRPSIFIRLVYAFCGSEVESNITEYIRGVTSSTGNNLGELSSQQLRMLNDLHCKIIKQEERLTTQWASSQEDIADQPISVIARGQSHTGEWNDELDRALHNHDQSMATILKEADNLRLKTLKELLGILTPVQAVDYLASSKKLHLAMHQWGKRKDLSW